MNELASIVTADIPRHLTAIAEWAACLVYILVAHRRGRWVGRALISVVALGTLLTVHAFAGTLPVALWVPGMLTAVTVMFLFLRTCARGNAAGSFYLTARALVLAELAASIYWQVDRFYASSLTGPAQTALCVAMYALIFASAWALERRHFTQDDVQPRTGELIGTIAIAAGTFTVSNLSFLSANTPFSARFGPEILYIRTLVDIAGFIALWAQQRTRNEFRARRDSAAMSQLLRSQHDQYESTRRAMDDVNAKYHDMKHYLEALRAEQDPRARAQMVDEVERSLRDYGSIAVTGDHVLDTILTAKRAYADENDVDVTVVADGALLSFMKPLDVTAIVGNAMDNAIEAASRVQDRDGRVVKVALFAQDDFVMLRFDNPFDGEVLRDGKRFISRKGGDDHGYGLRNIESAAAKYGGAVSAVADATWFSVRILFPRPRE